MDIGAFVNVFLVHDLEFSNIFVLGVHVCKKLIQTTEFEAKRPQFFYPQTPSAVMRNI